MHAVCAGRACDVGAVVDDERHAEAPAQARGFTRGREQFAVVQTLFAQLHHVDTALNGRLYEREEFEPGRCIGDKVQPAVAQRRAKRVRQPPPTICAISMRSSAAIGVCAKRSRARGSPLYSTMTCIVCSPASAIMSATVVPEAISRALPFA